MTITLAVESETDQEQRLTMPGTYDWQQFEALETLLAESTGLRITYLDGAIELMTIGEPHKLIKKSLLDLALLVRCVALQTGSDAPISGGGAP